MGQTKHRESIQKAYWGIFEEYRRVRINTFVFIIVQDTGFDVENARWRFRHSRRFRKECHKIFWVSASSILTKSLFCGIIQTAWRAVLFLHGSILKRIFSEDLGGSSYRSRRLLATNRKGRTGGIMNTKMQVCLLANVLTVSVGRCVNREKA